MSPEEAFDYVALKRAILLRPFTEDGFKEKFRNSRPEPGKSSQQFMAGLRRYFDRWTDLARVERSYEKSYEILTDLLIKK